MASMSKELLMDWRRMKMRFANKCACGKSLPVDTMAYGRKSFTARWEFQCHECYKKYESDARDKAAEEIFDKAAAAKIKMAGKPKFGDDRDGIDLDSFTIDELEEFDATSDEAQEPKTTSLKAIKANARWG